MGLICQMGFRDMCGVPALHDLEYYTSSIRGSRFFKYFFRQLRADRSHKMYLRERTNRPDVDSQTVGKACATSTASKARVSTSSRRSNAGASRAALRRSRAAARKAVRAAPRPRRGQQLLSRGAAATPPTRGSSSSPLEGRTDRGSPQFSWLREDGAGQPAQLPSHLLRLTRRQCCIAPEMV